MVEVDIITIITPAIISGAVAFIILAVNKVSKTSETTITGSIRIENVEGQLNKITNDVEKGIVRIETLVNKRDDEISKELSKMSERIGTNTNRLNLVEYRIDNLEKDKRSFKVDDKGGKGAV